MHEKSANIAWEFTDKKITPWGGLIFFKEFLDRTGIEEVLRTSGLPEPMSNRGYDPAVVMQSFWVSVWIGATRFSHTAMVRFDEALKEIFVWKRVPSVSTYTRFFRKFKQPDVDQVFGKINRWLFEQISPRTFTLDLDSSVITRYGEQEGSLLGYNPRKPGRPSHHPIMAFVADLRLVAHSWLRSGNTGSLSNAKNFFDETQAILGKHKIGLTRADSGFFSDDFLSYIEQKQIDHIVAVRMNSSIKSLIYNLKGWMRLEEAWGIEVTEFDYQAFSWNKPRRVVVIRQSIEQNPKSCGKYLFDMKTHRYQAWVTSLKLAPQEVWRLYRQRADSENRIEELKYDFGIGGFCSEKFYATEAVFRSVMIAYNLISLFRQVVLKLPIQPRLQTLRFKCFAIGSWIGVKYRNKVLKLSVPMQRRAWFEGLFSKIIDFFPPFRFKGDEITATG